MLFLVCANCFILPILFTSGFFAFLAQVLFDFCNCFDNIYICFFVTKVCYKCPLIFMTKYYALTKEAYLLNGEMPPCAEIELVGCLSLVWSCIHDINILWIVFFGKDFYISTNMMLGFPCVKSFQIKVEKKSVWSVTYLSIIYSCARTSVSEDVSCLTADQRPLWKMLVSVLRL